MQRPAPPRYEALIVSLDEDGLGGDNIFAIGARVTGGLRRLARIGFFMHEPVEQEIAAFQREIRDAPSYSAALAVVRAWATVENDPEAVDSEPQLVTIDHD